MGKRHTWVLLFAAVFLAGLVAAPVGAQVPTPIPTIIPTPGPSPSPSNPPPPPPQNPPPGESSPPSQSQPGAGVPSQSRQSAAPPSAGAFPAAAPIAVAPSILRTPPGSTARLLEILLPVVDSGLALGDAAVASTAPFPVAGPARYSHDFMFPRFVPTPHSHEGTDIFADFGTPIVASGPGVVVAFGSTAIGGLVIWIAGDDGTSFYYAHLLSFREGLTAGERVAIGSVLGYVGNTGNALTTPPHLHFEIHPAVKDKKGKIIASGVELIDVAIAHTVTPAADPKPYLDAWLHQAELRAAEFVARHLQRYAGLAKQAHISKRTNQLVLPVAPPANYSFSPVSVAADAARAAGLARLLRTQAQDLRVAEIRLAVESKRMRVQSLLGYPLFGYIGTNAAPN